MSEQWKPIIGFSRYKVSDLGRVFSLVQKIFIIPEVLGDGHYWVKIVGDDSKTHQRKVSRLVLETFRPQIRGYKQILHRDQNTRNNSVTNLRSVDEIKENHYELSTYSNKAYRDEQRIQKLEDFAETIRLAEDRMRAGIRPERNTRGVKHGKRKPKKVHVAGTLLTYNSIGACEADLAISRNSLQRILYGENKVYRGFTFEIVEE